MANILSSIYVLVIRCVLDKFIIQMKIEIQNSSKQYIWRLMYIGGDFPFLVCLTLYSGVISGDYYPLKKYNSFWCSFLNVKE